MTADDAAPSPESLAAELETRRYEALSGGDYETFATLLDDELRYVHSSSATDTKESYLAKLNGGWYDYGPVEHPIDHVRRDGDTLFVYGGMVVDVVIDGTPTHLDNVTTAIWRNTDAGWRLVHFQSTKRPQG